MKNIVIVGGGFAGLWAALGAAPQIIEKEANIQITATLIDCIEAMPPGKSMRSRPFITKLEKRKED